MTELRLHSPIPANLRDAGITTFADLFAGIGGFHYAATDLGLRCVFASEIDADAARQYEHNFGIVPSGDIRTTQADSIPDHDILFAGFPCQPFSIIGERQGRNDERGNLFEDILRVVKVRRPLAVILENVRQFSTIEGGAVLAAVQDGLNRLGYATDWRILNALNFGLPQKRERTIIIGMVRGIDLLTWPEGKCEMKPLSEILEPNPDPRHFVTPAIKAKRHKMHTPKIRPAIWHENKAGNISSHPFSCALRAGASYNYLLVDGERRLTPREQLRLQGFPEIFEVIGGDSAIRKQTGNAVPVPMVRAVIREVMRAASKDARRVGKEARAISA